MKKKKSVRRRAMKHMMKETLPLKPGEKLVTEALITETKAHVVWQVNCIIFLTEHTTAFVKAKKMCIPSSIWPMLLHIYF